MVKDGSSCPAQPHKGPGTMYWRLQILSIVSETLSWRWHSFTFPIVRYKPLMSYRRSQKGYLRSFPLSHPIACQHNWCFFFSGDTTMRLEMAVHHSVIDTMPSSPNPPCMPYNTVSRTLSCFTTCIYAHYHGLTLCEREKCETLSNRNLCTHCLAWHSHCRTACLNSREDGLPGGIRSASHLICIQ